MHASTLPLDGFRWITALWILALLFVLPGCGPDGAAPPAAGTAPEDPVQRGAYLVTILGCNDCHTPLQMGPEGPAPDMSRMLSGHPETPALPPPPALPEGPWNWVGAATSTAFAGPWGITYSPNLTPDSTGLGTWTEEMFVGALKTGKQRGVGRPIMPPMPWQGYAALSEEDLKAIYAYLKTIPPIKNQVPAYQAPAAPAQ